MTIDLFIFSVGEVPRICVTESLREFNSIENMGLCLTTIAEWADVPNANERSLEYNEFNNYLLESYANFLLHYTTKNPSISSLIFREPIKWKSFLTPDKMKNVTILYAIFCGFYKKLGIMLRPHQSWEVMAIQLRTLPRIILINQKHVHAV